MLGTLHDKWDKSESVPIRKGDTYIIVRGKRLEVKLEEKNQLRLSLVEMVDNRDEQHCEAVSGLMHLLEQRRKDLAINTQELKVITNKLDNEELDEEVEEELEKQARDKRGIKKKHAKEIKKLEAQTTISVHYRIVKTGLTAVLPPGLTLQPEFLSEPVVWCPWNMPASDLVEETTTMVEELPLSVTSAQHTTASGLGLEISSAESESKFVITAKDNEGGLRDSGGDNFVVESYETEIKSSVVDTKNGVYEVSYIIAEDFKESKQFSLAVTLGGRHISGSPFCVETKKLLLEFTTGGDYTKHWLDEAKARMSTISRAKLFVHLYDKNGSEVYYTTGVTSCKWSQDYITSPNRKQHFDDAHTNAIRLDNGDRMIIIGANDKAYHSVWGDAYYPSNIIITKGWDVNKLNGFQPRRMIIALHAPYVKGWVAPDNLISFSSTGFTQGMSCIWPKFNGTFRIYYKPL